MISGLTLCSHGLRFKDWGFVLTLPFRSEGAAVTIKHTKVRPEIPEIFPAGIPGVQSRV